MYSGQVLESADCAFLVIDFDPATQPPPLPDQSSLPTPPLPPPHTLPPSQERSRYRARAKARAP